MRKKTTFVILAVCLSASAYAQPRIPRDEIPEDIPCDVREAIDGLYSPDAAERVYYVIHLGKMGERAGPAAPYLLDMMRHNADAVVDCRWLMMAVLAPSVRCPRHPGNLAAEALGKTGAPAVDPLIAALKDRDRTFRATAARTLGNIRDPRAVEPLSLLLKDSDTHVRLAAVQALGEIADPRAAEPLLEYLERCWNDLHSTGADAAATALVKIGKPSVSLLVAALHHRFPAVRRTAAEALGRIGDPRAVEPLIIALEDAQVVDYAAKALAKIPDPRALQPLIAALRKKRRCSAAEALVAIDDPRGVEAVVDALKQDHHNLRACAAKALSKTKDPRAVEALIIAIDDKDLTVRAQAIESLGQIKDPGAVDALIAVLRDEEEWLRHTAIQALANIKDPRAVEPLIAALEDESRPVHAAAGSALRKITGKSIPGDDPRKWREWWEQNKKGFLEKEAQ